MNELLLELTEKLNNNILKQKEIAKNIELLPKGHINILKRNGRGYYYLTYREGPKIKNDYLGAVGKVDLTETVSKLRQRDIYIKETKTLKEEEIKINKLIKKLK